MVGFEREKHMLSFAFLCPRARTLCCLACPRVLAAPLLARRRHAHLSTRRRGGVMLAAACAATSTSVPKTMASPRLLHGSHRPKAVGRRLVDGMAHLERSVRPRRRALWAGGRAGECLRMRKRCAGGVRTRRAVHGATGAEWEILRIPNPLGEQTGRVGALDRLRSGLGGRQGCVRREAPAADSRVRSDWA